MIRLGSDKNVSEIVIYMHFFHSFWKNLHLTEIFYTDMSVVSVTNKRYDLLIEQTILTADQSNVSIAYTRL